MANPNDLINDQEHATIQAALREAEANTSGEIVPVIAASSGRYDRAEDLFGIVFAAVVLAVFWVLTTTFGSSDAPWSGSNPTTPGLFTVLLVLVVGFIAGSRLATKFPMLRAPLTSQTEMREEVERRAAECFHRFGIGKTAGATGVLIYVSLEEQLVRVEGDAAINDKLQSTDWRTACDIISSGIKNDGLTNGLNAGISQVGELLATHFPRATDDINELPDQVYLVSAR